VPSYSYKLFDKSTFGRRIWERRLKMIAYFFTPPGLYYLIGFIFGISLVVYWKREPIKGELRRWSGKEVSVGPLKLERKEAEEKKTEPSVGLRIGKGADLSGAKAKRWAGRDIRRKGSPASRGGATPGIVIEEKAKLTNAEIEDLAGRDLEIEE
jgi:hypothetical protein